MTSLQQDEETQVVKVLCLGVERNLQGAQKQLSEPEHSDVISLTAVTYDMEEESSVGLRISEIRTQGKLVTCAEQPQAAAKKLSEVESHKEQSLLSETSNEQTYTGLKHLNQEVSEELEGGSTIAASTSNSVTPVPRRRGRPPKKTKQPVKKILNSPSTDVSKDKEVPQAPSTRVPSADETLNTPPAESVQDPSVQTRERCTSATLQDAMLLVEAMNQSPQKNPLPSLQAKAPPQIQCVSRVGALETAHMVPAELAAPKSPAQTPSLTVLTHKIDRHVTEISTATKLTVGMSCDTSQTTDDTKPIPQQLQAVIPSNNTSPSSSTSSTQTGVSFQHRTFAASKKPHLIVTSQPGTSSTQQQSGTPPYPKITIIVPRKVSGVASGYNKKPSQETTKQESVETGPSVKVSSPLVVSSQQMSISQTASEQQATTLVGRKPITVSPEAPLATKQKLSAVVKLSRLPFVMSTRESVFISKLPLDLLSRSTMQEKQSSEVELAQPSKKVISLTEVPALSTGIATSLKETSATVSVYACQMSEEPSDIQDEASFLEKLPVESSAVSGTACKQTCNSDQEIISNAVPACLLPNDPPSRDKVPATLIQLTSFTSKDITDPHSQMTKTQFLAQLAVSPAVEAPKKVM